MNILRVIGGLVSFGIAACLVAHVVAAFRRVTLPTLREIGREQTYFFVVRLGPLSLTGWQILVFEALLAMLAVAFIVIGVYVFTRSNAG